MQIKAQCDIMNALPFVGKIIKKELPCSEMASQVTLNHLFQVRILTGHQFQVKR